jgi:hypothetical protein
MKKDETKETYEQMTLRILGYFQMLEFVLKAYIGHAYELIKHCVGDKIHFDYDVKDVKNNSLGRLLVVFAKLHPDEALLTRLKQLCERRNEIAHTSLIVVIGEPYDVEDVATRTLEFVLLADEVWTCLNIVMSEHRKLKKQLAELTAI